MKNTSIIDKQLGRITHRMTLTS